MRDRFPHEWLPEQEMIKLNREDVEFFRLGNAGYPAEKPDGAYFASIHRQDGTLEHQWMRFTESGKRYEQMLENALGGFGPIRVTLTFTTSYRAIGRPFWKLTFSPNNILAWRTALMEPGQFPCKNR